MCIHAVVFSRIGEPCAYNDSSTLSSVDDNLAQFKTDRKLPSSHKQRERERERERDRDRDRDRLTEGYGC